MENLSIATLEANIVWAHDTARTTTDVAGRARLLAMAEAYENVLITLYPGYSGKCGIGFRLVPVKE